MPRDCTAAGCQYIDVANQIPDLHANRVIACGAEAATREEVCDLHGRMGVCAAVNINAASTGESADDLGGGVG